MRPCAKAPEVEKFSLHMPGLVSFVYVVIWICLSAGVILFNKYILAELGFPYPISLTMIHMAFCSLASFVLVHILKIVSVPVLNRKQYRKNILPIGILFSMSLSFSNTAYLHLSVSFIQMLKALSPVIVFIVSCALGQRLFAPNVLANMIIITVGVMIASYGEINFIWKGVFVQLVGIVMEALRLVLVQILLHSEQLSLNSITTMYFISPVCFLFLIFPFCYMELPILLSKASQHTMLYDPAARLGILFSNACTAFSLNLAVYALIGKTSALTMNVAGVVKDWLLICLSNVIFHAPVSWLQIQGYALAFIGVCYYNVNKT
jgi:drug/metabolite transporter (DMT)-like permease